MNNKIFLWNWGVNKLAHILLCWMLAYTFLAIIPNFAANLGQYYTNRGKALFYLTGIYFFISVFNFSARKLSMINDRNFLMIDLASLVLLLAGSLLSAGNYGFLAAI